MATTVAWSGGSWDIPVRVKTLTELFLDYNVANTWSIPGWSDDMYSVLGTTIHILSNLCPVTYGYSTYVTNGDGVKVLVPAAYFTKNLVIDTTVDIGGSLAVNSSLTVSNDDSDVNVNSINGTIIRSPIITENSSDKNNSGKLNINYDDKIPTLRQDM